MPSYIARTHLGTCLWNLFADLQFEDVPLQDPEYQLYLKRWQAKVHPYARHEVNWKKPETDDNAKDIVEARAASGSTSGAPVSKTRWTSVFKVPIGASGAEAYREAAGKIEDHLRLQELTIEGKERKSDKRPTGYGFINKRGEIITLNATDPRDLEGFEKHKVWSEELEDLYTRHGDVARQIIEGFRAESRKGRPRQRIGAALYDHFGKVLNDPSIPEEKRQELWNLHNRIRHFYRSLAESTRLLEALRTGDNNKLRFLLPQNMDELLARVGGKRDATRLTRKIRLGKIIAHSVDICSGHAGADFNSLVRKAMDYYTTSVGQSDIKRNKAFVRVVRNAVAFSIRTHATWLAEGVNLHAENSFNADKAGGRKPAYRDLTLNKTAAGALECTKIEKIVSHARLIFGARKHEFQMDSGRTDKAAAAISRTDVLFDGSDLDKEVLWGLLRLAALVRNRSYHFDTKKRFLNTLESGLLRPPASKNELYSNPDVERPGSVQSHRI
ncbi:type VI-A CRISPR-associated RNA-guided ribonuclease Cas13a [Rhizobium lemnae]|uniref:CRISPR-associated endoribonuclease Cas13a n=1 Tax=Rhizobium lemnae TaxID=1214924 RepID=A0ABV8E8S2_9HYPH|nr:type VI-A CRISPR-associated RNA-guided ribonuclease Cas13a [Rhizobium lemnae]